MSWSTRLNTSWELLQRSVQVLRSNPRLTLFPVISGACTFGLALFFLAPIMTVAIVAGLQHHDWHPVQDRVNAAVYVYGAAIYIASMFVATFFNVAFYNEILRALAGEPVSIGAGFRFAVGKLRSIVLWSLFAATVGLVIRAIQDRLGWVGKLVMGLVGLGWSVAAVFAIPVLIRRDDSNPVATLRDSAATLKRTWGESLIGFLGIQLGGVAFVAAALLFGAGLILSALIFKSSVLMIVFGVVWVVAVLAAGFVINMAEHVYKCALYVYASEGVVPAPYTSELLNAGWKVKRQ